MNTVKNDIKNGMLKKCYLLYGGEAFIRNLYLKRLKTAAVGEAFPEMNIDIFNGDTDDIVNPMPIECDFASSENVDQLLSE